MRYWLIGLIVFMFALYLLRGVLLPFVAGMAVAYLFDPLADRWEAKGISRTLATSLIIGIFVLVTVGAVLLLIPTLVQQLADFIGRVPDYARKIRLMAEPLSAVLIERLGTDGLDRVREALAGFADDLAKWGLALVKGIWESGSALLNLLSLVFITPIVAFYLLRDWDRIIARVKSWLPRAYADDILEQARQIDETLAGFVRGQGLVCLILAVYYSVTLSVVGLEFGLIVGIGSGLISFVPFVGAISGFVAGLGLAVYQFDSWAWVGVVAAIFVVGQVLEGNVLTPKLVGERVGLHPVWVIFGALAGGALFGFVGVLIAVPVTAVVGVLMRYALGQYLDSRLYHGPSTKRRGK